MLILHDILEKLKSEFCPVPKRKRTGYLVCLYDRCDHHPVSLFQYFQYTALPEHTFRVYRHTKKTILHIHGFAQDPGNYACIGIEDNGSGMDDNMLRRLFEPFFSTKFMGRGLSMAAVLGIIKRHWGWTTVSSMIGKGTHVEIYLPQISPQ